MREPFHIDGKPGCEYDTAYGKGCQSMYNPSQLQIVLDAYDAARADGLCAEGAWEVARLRIAPAALDAILSRFPHLPDLLCEPDVDVAALRDVSTIAGGLSAISRGTADSAAAASSRRG
jgi:hypothetical protein